MQFSLHDIDYYNIWQQHKIKKQISSDLKILLQNLYSHYYQLQHHGHTLTYIVIIQVLYFIYLRNRDTKQTNITFSKHVLLAHLHCCVLDIIIWRKQPVLEEFGRSPVSERFLKTYPTRVSIYTHSTRFIVNKQQYSPHRPWQHLTPSIEFRPKPIFQFMSQCTEGATGWLLCSRWCTHSHVLRVLRTHLREPQTPGETRSSPNGGSGQVVLCWFVDACSGRENASFQILDHQFFTRPHHGIAMKFQCFM
ncbi:Hypothetical_protein [Hexamita inflata]|uniref:Hypothetical_protein n=1 Tax=Hexamita inflata TaxID=28002 RepID=A0AA86UUU5_9EUKA|nr:Hypothetical protein HINF_LOCUS53342 [Hexamita inflata]